MISLKRSIEQYDSLRLLAADAVRALSSTLEAIQQYVVETDPASVELFRAHLNRSIQLLGPCVDSPDPALIAEMPSRVRAELREYRDRAACYIDKLREDLATTASALHEMMQNFQNDDSQAEQQLTTELVHLHALARTDDLAEIKLGVQKSVASLRDCIEQMRREKTAIIAQLKDEIRVLQRNVEEAQRAAAMEAVTGVYKRDEFQKLVRREIVAERQICVINLWLSNFNELRLTNTPALIDQLLIAICKRMKSVLPSEAVVGRWQDDVFCVLLPSTLVKRTLPDLMQSCIGRYLCMDDGAAVTLHLQLTATCVTPENKASVSTFFERLQQLHSGCIVTT